MTGPYQQLGLAQLLERLLIIYVRLQMLGALLEEFAHIAVYIRIFALDRLIHHIRVEMHVLSHDLQLIFADFLRIYC